MNYRLLLALFYYNYYFWLQYVGVALTLVYFLAAMWSVYTTLSGKRSRFVSLYVFVLLSCGFISPVFPIPCSFVSPGLPRALFIWGFNVAVFLLVLFLHIGYNIDKRAMRLRGQ